MIVGRCELLTSGAAGDMTEPQLRNVEAIVKAARRLQEMIDELGALT